ncbi:hypothetical protein NY486_13850, partial [Enterobacter hormaechei]|nr:hypothetical protein [Enterobacter hormaechei]
MGDDDHVIAGLSPAAQLARQHTARSKAKAEEAQRRAAAPQVASISEMGAATGEPTWDSNT